MFLLDAFVLGKHLPDYVGRMDCFLLHIPLFIGDRYEGLFAGDFQFWMVSKERVAAPALTIVYALQEKTVGAGLFEAIEDRDGSMVVGQEFRG
ncbi:hypothetical protein SDC9_178759 [bioreactor metagenome]|uniref:Uncharacterized protein n=1 Tax=bioreactor metagenome TaxID=1076179 RepID=A0A645GWU9_9ZZZZ